MDKEYLGDGVYLEWKDGEFILTTENGIEATNTIVLEPEVMAAFLMFLGKRDLIKVFDKE
jgi:hypothetical protein